jgi:exopolysaccharide biosynthesis WecB/TagA/CpsF family protein
VNPERTFSQTSLPSDLPAATGNAGDAAMALADPLDAELPLQQARSDQDLAGVYDLVRSVRLVASQEEESALVEALVGPRHATTVAFLNQHGINLAYRNVNFRNNLRRSDVLLRDGVGTEVAMKLLGCHPGLNINGTDFIPKLLMAAAAHNLSIAVLGTKDPWLSGAIVRLREMGLRVVASLDGFQDTAAYVALVRETNPNVVLLGMGMPRQEEVADLLARTDSTPRLIINGGAILDFYAGRVKRAPSLFRAIRAEWIWRLLNEPKRLASRYITGGFAFFGTLARLFVLHMNAGPADARTEGQP